MHFFQTLFSWVAVLPPPLGTALIAMVPSVELSVAIPFGILKYRLPAGVAFSSAVAGSFLVALLVFSLAEPVSHWLQSRSKLAARFFSWVFARTRGKFSQKYERYGEFALLLFVAFPLPLPLSGAWTASLAAWLFGIPPRRALPLILLGLLIAGGIMLAVTYSGSALLGWFVPDGVYY
ncbi:MAG: small multi-drug export protein [bacterium]|nr:small multi-drug export protein [bacterium]